MNKFVFLAVTLAVFSIALCGCGKKPEPENARPADDTAAAFNPGQLSDDLYIEFYAHYRMANARLLQAARTKAGKQTPIEIQRAHMTKLKEETQALEKELGVTKQALDDYIDKKKSRQPDYWVKMIHPGLQERTAELEEESGMTP